MDRIAEWRPVEPAGPDGSAEKTSKDQPPVEGVPDGRHGVAARQSLLGRALIGLTLAGFALAGGISLVVFSTMPRPQLAIDAAASVGPGDLALVDPSAATGDAPPMVVVDIEGAVQKPGLWHLAAGSRVGDAVDAAGGYSAQVDIQAATSQLNLAEVLVDGQKITVPLRGETIALPSAGTSPMPAAAGSPAAGRLIDVNTATADLLDTLPGIGPVTAAKIIAARPFSSVDDLQGRGVVNASTLEKIRSLITVAP